jgi:type III restriction enzyme
LRDQLRQGKVLVRNWHVLNWETDDKLKKRRSVDKRGAKSDEAYVREVLGEMAKVNNIIVINDEAHHAWRVNPETKTAKIDRKLIEDATKWVGGLDRIHKARKIHRCFDFSATPFSPSGKQSSEESLFGWIVSDFGLNDAIEGGLVKTPRVVVRDDGMPDVKNYKSKLYHIYDQDGVRDDLSRGAEAYEPLPDLVMNAYLLLGKDWLATYESWMKQGYTTPPVMITVANRTETAARVKNAFDKKKVLIDELCDPEKTLHIDSKVLDLAEAKDEEGEPQTENGESEDPDEPKKKLTKAEQGEILRKTVDTVGKLGEPGEQIRNVISVGMLSEGWDAKTVTHIMGLRAFSSQLLCEQVVGRGLRRTSYEAKKMPHPITGEEVELFEPEYVNIFGVPFTFLPHEGGEDGPLPPPPPKTRIAPEREKLEFLVSWPNIIRIDHVFRPKLEMDLKKIEPLTLNATDKIESADMAAVVAGKPNLAVMTEIDLQTLAERFRLQKIVFEVARDIYDQMQPAWRGNKQNLLAQVVRLVEKFITSPMLEINPPLFYQDEMRRRVMLTLNMTKIVQHVFEQIKESNTEKFEPVFDSNKPIRATADMLPWFTGKPVVAASRSHINLCVADMTWEAQAAYELDHNTNVAAWAKNDHLGFEIIYIFAGIFHKYRPDFLIRLTTGTNFVLEIKGQNTPKDQTKRRYLDEWVKAVNEHGGFGKWRAGLCLNPSDLPTVIQKAATEV